jgi:LmbE family N-acetylglucosaminyl deacetylase
MSTLLFVHAHSDDESIFTGATMRRAADRGCRVLLACLTGGEEGGPTPGLELRDRRAAELSTAAGVLGVEHTVIGDWRDSGMPGASAGEHPGSLRRARLRSVSGWLAALGYEHEVDAVIGYDPGGIYPHPDHLVVHHATRSAGAQLGVPVYEATVDRTQLHADHVLRAAAAGPLGSSLGSPAAEVTLHLIGSPRELTAKRAAMAAHRSQLILPDGADAAFSAVYGHEWYRTAAARGPLHDLLVPVAAGGVSPDR